MTTSGILHREGAEDIDRLEKTEPPKSCTAFLHVRAACVRALRLSEDARTVGRQNRMLLLVLIAINLAQAKESMASIVGVILKLIP